MFKHEVKSSETTLEIKVKKLEEELEKVKMILKS